MNIFFYARNDPVSVQLYDALKKEQILDSFKMVCTNDLRQIPAGVSAPTLMINGTNKLFVKQDAFKWIMQLKYLKNKQLLEQNKQLIQHKLVNDGPKGYLTSEMAGISDTYAYTDVDMHQPKVFIEYGKDADEIITGDENGKLNESEQARRMHEVVNNRKKEENNYIELAKKAHKEALERETMNTNKK